jgi:peptide/nickel transport system permease protein
MQDATVITATPQGRISRPLPERAWWLCRRQPVGVISSIILLFLMLVALASPLIQTHDPVDVSGIGIESPSSEHWFGTDRIGRDVFSRTVAGARISLGVGFGVLLVVVPIGTLLGLLSGYIGGTFDTITQRLVDLFLTIPTLLLALVIVTALGPSIPNVIFAVSFVQTPNLIRLVRSVVLSVKESDYVTAARAIGARNRRILVFHVLPQTFVAVIVMATVILPNAIIVEAGLSFLGLGVPPPAPSWGRELSEARPFLQQAPWLWMAPGAVIALTVFSGNMLGDMLRDILDPRLRGTQKR